MVALLGCCADFQGRHTSARSAGDHLSDRARASSGHRQHRSPLCRCCVSRECPSPQVGDHRLLFRYWRLRQRAAGSCSRAWFPRPRNDPFVRRLRRNTRSTHHGVQRPGGPATRRPRTCADSIFRRTAALALAGRYFRSGLTHIGSRRSTPMAPGLFALFVMAPTESSTPRGYSTLCYVHRRKAGQIIIGLSGSKGRERACSISIISDHAQNACQI